VRKVILYFVLLIILLGNMGCSRQPVYSPANQEGANVVIEIASLQPEIPLFFTYKYQQKPISFFVIKVKDNVLSFLDACASCYPHKKGYKYGEGYVTCRACSMKFSVLQLEKGLGGCFPIKIEGKIEKGKYVIPIATLEHSIEKF